jgi:hypothetical protein
VSANTAPKFCFPTFHDVVVHPDNTGLNERVLAWLQLMGCVSGHEAESFRAHRLLDLGAHMFATLPAANAERATRWLALVFLIDDDFDAGTKALDPSALHRAVSAIRAESGPRFDHLVGQYLAACAWERQNRRDDVRPTLAEYEAMRPHTSAVLTLSDFCRHDLVLAPWFDLHPAVQTMDRAAALIASYVNDFYSAKKEGDDAHNIVTLAGQNAAEARVVALTAELFDAITAAGQLAGAKEYGERLCIFVQGAIEWMPSSGRYA